MHYEYKVVPAPAKPRKAPRVKGAEAKFAYSLEATMNEYAADGWEYQRADILPSEERRGLRSSQTVYRTVLVFRRPVAQENAQTEVTAPPAAVAEDAPKASNTVVEHETRDAESRVTFSHVGPARRAEETGAPPLAAPHVSRDAPADVSTDTDVTDERR